MTFFPPYMNDDFFASLAQKVAIKKQQKNHHLMMGSYRQRRM